ELTALAEKELKRSGEFTLPGMVKLVVQKRKARMGRNPATGEAIKIPAKTVVKARIAKQMKDAGLPRKEAATPSPATDNPQRAFPGRWGKVLEVPLSQCPRCLVHRVHRFRGLCPRRHNRRHRRQRRKRQRERRPLPDLALHVNRPVQLLDDLLRDR